MIPKVYLPPKLKPVFIGQSRYRGAYGGRGSGKTRSFAKMAAVWAVILAQAGETGVIVCGREFMNSLDESSFAEVKAAIESEDWLKERFDVGEKYIRTLDKRINFVFCGLRHNLGSIKSKAKIHLMWIDEAEPVSEKAWQIIIPTVRETNSELWVTWNPERKNSATNIRFRENPPKNSKIVELNWRDNPKFPEVLEEARLDDLENRPESYDHIWEGDYVTVVEGAYFAKNLTQARLENRICNLSRDPLMSIYAFWDIGGTGAKADACAIWICQFIGKEIRVIDYYEAQGQPLAAHINWLRDKKYDDAEIYLPHDGIKHDFVYTVTYESELTKAEFSVTIVENQGTGAAMQRIESARRMFHSVWFDKDKCAGGIDALAWYHEKLDDKRSIGLGPCHDWSSHAADSFGMLCLVAETKTQASSKRPNNKRRAGWRSV